MVKTIAAALSQLVTTLFTVWYTSVMRLDWNLFSNRCFFQTSLVLFILSTTSFSSRCSVFPSLRDSDVCCHSALPFLYLKHFCCVSTYALKIQPGFACHFNFFSHGGALISYSKQRRNTAPIFVPHGLAHWRSLTYTAFDPWRKILIAGEWSFDHLSLFSDSTSSVWQIALPCYRAQLKYEIEGL